MKLKDNGSKEANRNLDGTKRQRYVVIRLAEKENP